MPNMQQFGLTPEQVFRGVFEQIFFPYLSVDLDRLIGSLRRSENGPSSISIPLSIADGAKRPVLAASAAGLISRIQVADPVAHFIANSEPVKAARLSSALMRMATSPGAYSIRESADELVWTEESLWPIAYSTLFDQLVGILDLHRRASDIQAHGGLVEWISEYPRLTPTHLHYAVASLAAWLAGAPNVQYFAFYATQPQLRKPEVNADYARRIKYYRAPFRARPLESIGLYGAKEVTRDHYRDFYAGLPPGPMLRCKHYCSPLIEVSSSEELAAHVARIPLRSKEGVFFRGQTCLYMLSRTSRVRQLLFADSCAYEPSMITSAARDPTYDYDTLHYALRHFLEQRILTDRGAKSRERIEAWRKAAASPLCTLDYALMALAQHYGVKSHGLDITLSLDVALWFATNRFSQDSNGVASYQRMELETWPKKREQWPVVFVHQAVTNSIQPSLFDCHDLDGFDLGALRPVRQHAKFFLGGHSDHQNRLAETIVCAFRLTPGVYETESTFDMLLPSPEEDPAYGVMLQFADVAEFTQIGAASVARFHV